LLDEELLDASEEGALTIAVDLSRVTCLDRVAVRILLEAAERQRDAGGELFVATRNDSRLGYRIRPFNRDEATHVRPAP
jgi:anti-anti-sigma regulatory factor